MDIPNLTPISSNRSIKMIYKFKKMGAFNKNEQDKKNTFLDNSHLKKNLNQRSAKGGAISMSAQIIITGLNLVRGAILARLIAPEDYGLQGMLMGVVSLALIFKDLGLGTATIREKQISQSQVSNLFWANILIGLISMLIVMACGPLFAWFYNEPRLTGMSVVLSIGYLFGGLSVQHQALLRRQMLFGRLAFVTIVANLLSSGLGILLGYLGFGYWALVWMLTSTNIILALGFALFTGWIPDIPSRKSGVRSMLKTGTDVAVLNAFSTLAKHVDKILLGKFIGPHGLGLYHRAFTFINQINGNIRLSLFGVALPAMSSIQSKPEQFRSYFLKFVAILAQLTMPIAAVCFCFADEIVLFYLGPTWVETGIFLRILSIGAFIMPVVTSLDQIPLALGFSARYRNSGIFRSIFSVVLVFFGVFYSGAIGAAVAISLSHLFYFPVFLYWTTKGSPIKPTIYLRILVNPILVSLIPVFCVEFYRFIFPVEYHAGISFVLFVVIYLFVFIITDLFEIGSNLKLIKKAIDTVEPLLSKKGI